MPLLPDLQVLEPRFVFEPRTIQRMELRVMATLNWRLRSVTPFDYLHHFIRKLPSRSTLLPDSFSSVISASSDLILSTTRGMINTIEAVIYELNFKSFKFNLLMFFESYLFYWFSGFLQLLISCDSRRRRWQQPPCFVPSERVLNFRLMTHFFTRV